MKIQYNCVGSCTINRDIKNKKRLWGRRRDTWNREKVTPSYPTPTKQAHVIEDYEAFYFICFWCYVLDRKLSGKCVGNIRVCSYGMYCNLQDLWNLLTLITEKRPVYGHRYQPCKHKISNSPKVAIMSFCCNIFRLHCTLNTYRCFEKFLTS